jgi:hypothetical protein
MRRKVLQWIWNLIWEWRLTLPSFVLATAKLVYLYLFLRARLRIGDSCPTNHRSNIRLILAPCAIIWSVVQQSVPRFVHEWSVNVGETSETFRLTKTFKDIQSSSATGM